MKTTLKSAVLGIILFLFCISNAYSQVIKSAGIKSGVVFSDQKWTYKNGNINRDVQSSPSLNLAFNLEWFNHKNLTMVTDLGYWQKGTVEDIMITTVDRPDMGSLSRFYNYSNNLYFSPQAKIRKDFGRISPYLLLGPRVDYQFKYTSRIDNYDQEIDNSDFENIMEPIVFGVNLGIGVSYKIRRLSINLELANYRDLTDMIDIEPSPLNLNTGIRVNNNALLVNLGVNYQIVKK